MASNGSAELNVTEPSPYRGRDTNRADNGLLLRADLHTLFDLRLIAVDETTMTVRIHPALATSSYGDIDGRALRLPRDRNCHPSPLALAEHRSAARL